MEAEAENSVLLLLEMRRSPFGVCCWGPRPADPREDRAAAGTACAFVRW